MIWLTLIAVLFSIGIGAARLLGIKSIPYQAVSHVWVGAILGYSIAAVSPVGYILFLVLCLVELYAFFYLKIV